MNQPSRRTRRHLVRIVVAVATLGLLLLAYAWAAAREPALPAAEFRPDELTTTMPPRGKVAIVSDERTRTLSAYVRKQAPIYSAPRESGQPVGHLKLTTEDGYLEPYLVRRVYVDHEGRLWSEVRIPGRPNGRVGWVRRNALEPFERTESLLVVDRDRLTIGLYRNGDRRWERPVAIGKASTPTPAGRFYIRERIKIRNRRSPYWPYALGTSAYSSLPGWPGGGVVAIHGDAHAPALIPGRVSHGCIRMRNQDIAWLAPRIEVGTPVLII